MNNNNNNNDNNNNSNNNKLTVDEWLELYHKTIYWTVTFPSQFLWLVLAFFVSYIANGGFIIRIGVVVYFIFGMYKYFYYKEIHDNFPRLY